MPQRRGELRGGARLLGSEQRPVPGPGFQPGKIIFTFVFAIFPSLKPAVGPDLGAGRARIPQPAEQFCSETRK